MSIERARSLVREKAWSEAVAVLVPLVGQERPDPAGAPGRTAPAAAWALLARAEMAQGHRAASEQAVRRALEAGPDDAEALLAAIEVALATRRVDRALDLTRHTLAVNDTHPAAWLSAALVLAARRIWDDAARCVEAGLALDPDDPALLELGARVARERHGQWWAGARLSRRGGALRRQ